MWNVEGCKSGVGAKLMENEKIDAICNRDQRWGGGILIGKSIFDIDGDVRTLIFKIVEDVAGGIWPDTGPNCFHRTREERRFSIHASNMRRISLWSSTTIFCV